MNITTVSLLPNIILIPELFLGLSIVYLVFHCLFFGHHHKNKFFLFVKSLIFLISLTSWMTFLILVNQSFGCLLISNFSNSYISDNLSNFSKRVICLLSFLFFLFIEKFVSTQKINSFEYYIIFMFGILGTFLICSANDLLAAYLSILLKNKIKWFPYAIFIWAAVVAYSRIYLGVHFPIDILVGAFVGTLLGVIFAALARKVINKQNITS